jgi:hypothetical protein
LFDSPADWISPNSEGGYRENPPTSDGRKVIITDTDHLWGIGGNSIWVWKSVLRGLNPIFMDPYDGSVLRKGFDPQWVEPIRRSMGAVVDWSRRVDLARMIPHPELVSSRYCLANPGVEYLVLLPNESPTVTVNLPQGRYGCLWFDTTTGQETAKQPFEHSGSKREFRSPFAADALLYVHREAENSEN